MAQVATFQTAIDGANPFQVDGPASLGSGVIVPSFRLGHVSYGDCETEYVYVKYTSVSNQVLSPGFLFQIDDDYVATILTTSAAVKGNNVGVCCIGLGYGGQSFTTVTGTVYYMWLARAGHLPVAYVTSTINATSLAETSATAGKMNYPTAPSTTTKFLSGLFVQQALTTFTGTVVSGSNVVTITGNSLTPDGGPAWIGSTLSATGIAASQTITSLIWTGQLITGIVLSANATVNATNTTITPTLITPARVYWPWVDKTNP